MTPTDLKIEIMNRTYATVVHKLTNEIIDLKMKQEPTIDTEIIISDEEACLHDLMSAMMEATKLKADRDLYKTICAGLSVIVVVLFFLITAMSG